MYSHQLNYVPLAWPFFSFLVGLRALLSCSRAPRRNPNTRLRRRSAPAVADWLLWSWHFDKDRPSKDEVLRHCLEHTVAELKSQLPTYWQIHESAITGKNPYECERKITPRPPGAGLFVGEFFDQLRPHVVKNGLGNSIGRSALR